MFKVVLTNTKKYQEEPQVNPIRWKTMFREGDTYTDQSGWIKCKDFFNDTVAFFKAGTVFSIYSYKNDIKKNEEGVYMLLDNIKDRAQFIHNLEVLAGQCAHDELDWAIPIQPYASLPSDQILILIPNCFWESTYLISLISKCIRLSNYGIKYEKWEDWWAPKAPALTLEHGFSGDTIKFVKTNGFKLPKGVSKYWYFCGTKYNSSTLPDATGSMIHDNGADSWVRWMNNNEGDEW